MSAPGYRDDGGKPRWDLLPPDATEQVVRVLTQACTRTTPPPYPARNWELGMAWSRCFGSMMRHAWKWWSGEDNDSDSGLSHMAHVACNALFLVAYVRRPALAHYDDRPKQINAVGVADPLKDCPSCAGTNGYHRTPCEHFEVAHRGHEKRIDHLASVLEEMRKNGQGLSLDQEQSIRRAMVAK